MPPPVVTALHVSFEDEVMPERLSKFEQMKQMALFLLRTKEVQKVSQVALDSIAADFALMLQNTVDRLKCDVEGCRRIMLVSY